MISNLHYITQGATPQDHLANLEKMCKAGIDWVQLRLKNQPFNITLKTAEAAKAICDAFKVTLIINDFPEIAHKVNAHGVHLGKQDQCPLAARKLLGPEKIIGGTANTLQDCLDLYEKGVHYIGLGPFRFTTTKENLSPVLGAKGYERLLEGLRAQNKTIPVIAIGGITLEDLPVLVRSGIHGVALSGALTHDTSPAEKIRAIKEKISTKYI